MKPIAMLFCAAIAGTLLFVIVKVGEADAPIHVPNSVPDQADIDSAVIRVNGWLHTEWAENEVEQAEPADDLTVFRRLSLALHGTIPSLREIAAFEADRAPNRVQRWVLKMLEDQRFADYMAERLERVLVGIDVGQFVLFRRDRLRTWLAQAIRNDMPWDKMTTELIAADGLWTSQPQVNFVTGALIPDEGLDIDRLTGRTVRAFLGQRIDCAQCHDDFVGGDWLQSDFEGLAGFYGQTAVTVGGVIDQFTEKAQVENEQGDIQEVSREKEYRLTRPGADEEEIIAPKVPFHPEWITSKGSRRQQLASWIVHPENKRFERAIANRMWGLMFGKAWTDAGEIPRNVDDVNHPSEDEQDLLDVLGSEFRSHDHSLKFLIRLIAETDAFRLSSDMPDVDEQQFTKATQHWAVFPLVRLRPEQVIGAMVQSSSVRTIDRNSNLFIRFLRFSSENDFLREYGDSDDEELLQKSGTIPQALLRMNGRFTSEFTKAELLSSVGFILRESGRDESIIDNCFLATLTRRPSKEEREFFMQEWQLAGESEHDREQAISDIFWTLLNAPGFSWNH